MKNFRILSTAFYIFVFFSSAKVVAQEIKWQNALGGNSSDVLYSINRTPNGGYICGGRSDSPISGDKTKPRQGETDYWVIKLDSSGNKEWDKVQGGSESDYLSTVIPTNDGGYICGGTSLSGISGHKTEPSRGNFDFWVIKLNSGGNIHWQKTIGGSGHDWLYSIIQTSDGGYFVAGSSASNISGEKTENCIGGLDYWVLKLDAVGNIEWQNTIGGSALDELSMAVQTSDGGYICAGSSQSGISGDKTDANRGISDYWIVKIDTIGNIIWQKTFGGNDIDLLASIALNQDGEIICGGSSRSGISGDKTGFNRGFPDYWILKLDSIGNLQWQKTLGGSYYDELYTIDITSDGGYVCAGRSESDVGFEKTEPSMFYDIWVVKLDSIGSIKWQNSIGGIEIDAPAVIHELDPDEYIVGAYSVSGLSGDKMEVSQGGWDFWVLNLTNKFNSITGKVFLDGNSNGIQDPGEVPLNNLTLTENITGRVAFTNSNGDFYLPVVDTGNFSVSAPTITHYASIPTIHTASFPGYNETDSLNDFAFQPIGIFNDLKVTITPMSPFRPGFNAGYTISYQNSGNTTLNTTIVLYPDNNLTFATSNPAPTNITMDSIYWDIGNVAPFQSGNILVSFNLSPTVGTGVLINTGVTIQPVSGDAQPADNTGYWEVITTGSYDPNDILVNRDTLFNSEIPNPPYLEYIIRFQNTGTDTAFVITILNNIDTTRFLPGTIQFVSSSHPVDMRYIHWERNLEFAFENILLPDSNVNEPESHGFVRYRIKPKPNLLITNQIKNAAGIYFDFNPVVMANTALTIFVLPTGLETFDDENGLIIFPNPAVDQITVDISAWEGSDVNVELFNVYGQLVGSVFHGKVENTNMNIEQSLHGLSSGIYLVKVSSRKGVANFRFLKM